MTYGMMPSRDRQDVAANLYAAATDAANAKGFRLGQGADHDIRQMAERAVDRLGLDDLPDHDVATAIQTARNAFERLVEQMVLEVDAIPGYRENNPGVIGEHTLRRALDWLCPLFPIC
jgi:hypothetical protein